MSPAKSPRRVLGYVRVSTSEQGESGLGLDAQREKIAQWCALHGAALVGVVVDAGASAATLERPGLTEALSRLGRGDADALLVAKLDRLTRSVRDLGALIDGPLRRSGLVSVAESIDTRTAAGRLVLNVLGSVAQWEREAIGERTREALAAKKRRGERSGQIPFGFRLGADGRTLERDDAEHATIERVRAMREAGISLKTIARTLNDEKIPARGSRWHPTTIARIASRSADDAPALELDPNAPEWARAIVAGA